MVFTGGGILGSIATPTCASGTRDATIRPSVAPYIIPQTFIEKPDLMYEACNCGRNSFIYAMAVRIDGYMSSDLYLEAFDDNSFSTTDLEVLYGTDETGFESFVNAIRTTDQTPAMAWNGTSTGAAYVRGTEHRVPLGNASTLTDTTVYYNIYIELPTDCSTFHATPVIAFRYLYI